MSRYNRLVGSQTQANDVVEIRGIRIDKTARRVMINGEEKNFTTKNLIFLTFLGRTPRIMFSQKKNCSGKSGIWIRLATLPL